MSYRETLSRAQPRQAEEDHEPIQCDSYRVRLDTVRGVLAKYHRTSQEKWLLGPEQCGETGQLCWRVAKHGNDDPAQMGRIVAWELPSGEASVEFRLDNFPDVAMFDRMIGTVERDVQDRILLMVKNVNRFKSGLAVEVEATMPALDQCLREFHAARSKEEWCWRRYPTTGKAVLTRLALWPGGLAFEGGQIWCVEALDVPSEMELATVFCTIVAGPLYGPDDEAGDELCVGCWPDWNKVKTPASYRKYLGELMVEFQRRAFIQDLPAWLTEAERMEAPETASETMAEPVATMGRTEAVPVSALSPVQREGTGDSAPGQVQAEPPPPVRDDVPTADGQGERTTTEHVPPPERCVFRQRDESWEIAFGGKTVHMKDIKGLQYIALLLRNPYSELDVMAMVNAVGKDVSDTDTNIQAEESLDSVSDLGDNQAVLDPKAIRESEERLAEIKKRIIELGEEREKVAALDNTDRLRKIEEEEEELGKEALEINKYLRDGIGLHGRSRSFPTPRTNARSSVQQAIKTALDKVRQCSSPLSEYLQSTISTGIKCSYNPDPSAPISWDV